MHIHGRDLGVLLRIDAELRREQVLRDGRQRARRGGPLLRRRAAPLQLLDELSLLLVLSPLLRRRVARLVLMLRLLEVRQQRQLQRG